MHRLNTRKATLVAPLPHLQVELTSFFLPFHLVNLRSLRSEILFDNSFRLSAHHSQPHRAVGMSDTQLYIIHYSRCCHYPEMLYCVWGTT